MAEIVIVMAGCLIVFACIAGGFALGWWTRGKAENPKKKQREVEVEKGRDEIPLTDQISNLMSYTGREE